MDKCIEMNWEDSRRQHHSCMDSKHTRQFQSRTWSPYTRSDTGSKCDPLDSSYTTARWHCRGHSCRHSSRNPSGKRLHHSCWDESHWCRRRTQNHWGMLELQSRGKDRTAWIGRWGWCYRWYMARTCRSHRCTCIRICRRGGWFPCIHLYRKHSRDIWLLK